MNRISTIVSQERKEWIDVLRALAIIFVTYGHALKKGENAYIYFVFTSPIKIPLFFTISGYLFKDSRSFRAFSEKIIRSLVVPWLCLSIIPILLISIIKGWTYLQTSLVSILTGVSVWYMPCCIIAEFIFYFVIKNLKKEWKIVLASVIFTVTGIILIHFGIIDMLMANRALSVQLFLCIGHLIKKHQKLLDNARLWHMTIGAISYIGIGVISVVNFPEKALDVHQGFYYNVPISFFMIIIGCILLFIIGKSFSIHNKILSYIGKNTLICYIWASYPFLVYDFLSKRLHLLISNIFIDACVKTVFTILCCCLASILVNRFLPEIVGKR